MSEFAQILQRAQQRANESFLSYSGLLTPAEAFYIIQQISQAHLIDVRSHAERDLVGRIPACIEIEWQSYPHWVNNPHFLPTLQRQVDPETLVIFICRTGSRSHQAALAAMAAGFTEVYNVQHGFEGEKNKFSARRGELNGWKAAGLPWINA